MLMEKGTIDNSRARNHKGLKLVKDPDGGVEGIIDSISELSSIALQVISDKTEIKVDGGETSSMLTGNTFECHALSEATVPLEGVGDLASTSYMIPDTEDFFDTSPNCDTFKQVRRIDELDYSPMPLPLSKSKLKRRKKKNRDPKHVDVSSVAVSHD